MLTGAILLAVPLTSFATGANNKIKVVSKTKSSQFQVATVEVDGKTIIAEYDSSSKQMIITTKSGSNIEEVLHIDPYKSQYSQNVYGEPAVDVLSNEQAGKYRVGYQHTITDYEYTHCYHDILYSYDSGGHLVDTTKSYHQAVGG